MGRHTLGPSYQLAVVTDDAMMGVSQVIRGLDLVPSTPRQILLYRALGWNEPRFGHVPLAITPTAVAWPSAKARSSCPRSDKGASILAGWWVA